jgi:DNA-binding NarL/FixJ family response regulator
MKRPTVILADDHTMIAQALQKLLEAEYDVVAIVQDGRTLLETAEALKPDVVIIDVGMPLLNGLSAGQRIKQQRRGVKLIYVTMNEDADLAAEALRTGGSAYLLKSSAAAELLKAMKEALRGGTYVTPKVKKSMDDSFIRVGRRDYAEKRLTPRQIEVLQLLAEGKSMKEVGATLFVTARTVAFHKYRIMEVLNLTSNAELIKFAVNHNLVFSAPPVAVLEAKAASASGESKPFARAS